MITPQFSEDESNLGIIRENFFNLVNTTIVADLRPKIFIAYALARFSHLSQTRDEGTPYIVHPLRIALYLMDTDILSEEYFKSQNNHKTDAIIIALLHDTAEDYGENILPLIREEFGENILEMVQFLTKKKNYNNTEYYDNLKKAPEIVKIIKVLDRLDNLRGLLKSEIKSNLKKKAYLKETEDKTLPLLNSNHSNEYHKLIKIFQNIISFLETALVD